MNDLVYKSILAFVSLTVVAVMIGFYVSSSLVEEVVAPTAAPSVGESSTPMVTMPEDEAVFCTQDARECPDGSFVGRVGPKCEFAPCPPVAPR